MSQKCDIYSFGVVLLELLTGQAPVDTNTSRQVASHKLTMELHPLLVNVDLEGMKVLCCCAYSRAPPPPSFSLIQIFCAILPATS